jgi:cell pole-organizing protein PopZ
MAETKMKAVRPPDPSMEEILASIRRIISEEPAREQPKRVLPAGRFGIEPAATRTGESAVPAHARPEEMLKSIETADLAAALSVAKPAPPVNRDGAAASIQQRPLNGDARSAQRPLYASVVSPGTSSAAAEQFGRLAQAVQPAESRTMEEFVEDMLRPMLQSWLDENLPGLVERLVRQEIERVSRGVF